MAQHTPASTAAAVHAEQIRTLYHQSLVIAAVNPLNAAIVATVLWPSADHRLLIAWVAAMTAVTLVRALTWVFAATTLALAITSGKKSSSRSHRSTST